MRKIEFSELKIKDNIDEDKFYLLFLKNLQKEIKQENIFKMPEKKYEIFYLNILGGKIILLNKDFLPINDEDNQDLFYDYEIAYNIYNFLLDIYDGIENEQFEFNELYKNERLQKDSKIEELKLRDNEIFNNKIREYNIVKNSLIYKEYLNLIEENEKLKQTNNELIEKINTKIQNENIGFFQKILNKFRAKKLLNNGENK